MVSVLVLVRQVFLLSLSVLCVVYSTVHGAVDPTEKAAAGTNTVVREEDFYFDSSSFLQDVIGTSVLATVVTAVLTLLLKDQDDVPITAHSTPKHVPGLSPVDEGDEGPSDSGDDVRRDIEAESLGRGENMNDESSSGQSVPDILDDAPPSLLQPLRTVEGVEAPSYSDVAPAQASEEEAAGVVLVEDFGGVEEKAEDDDGAASRAEDGAASCSPVVIRDFARYIKDLKEQTRSEMQETTERLNKMSACQAQVLGLAVV